MSSFTHDELIAAWKAIHPSNTLSDELQTLYLTFFTAAAAGRMIEALPADRTNEPPHQNFPRENLPPPQRFQRRNRSNDKPPPGPAKQFDQYCTNPLSELDAATHKQDEPDSNFEQMLPDGPSET
eukprot:CAMPEP_0172166122 /NCGR_PEP_ID=MMETSP1050-20130122/8802_1 /TAXON_ID=233186 /ORGANISM="Cryptomonas curvata, Strain CCAP979/52" /LENGTH=124 /DNA_ID=CAMNT_0012836689 /DNA_START=22 /DNA_END=396 /DNA_ORIENTATION=+